MRNLLSSPDVEDSGPFSVTRKNKFISMFSFRPISQWTPLLYLAVELPREKGQVTADKPYVVTSIFKYRHKKSKLTFFPCLERIFPEVSQE